MRAVMLLVVGLVLGSLFGAVAVAAVPWHFYTVDSLVGPSVGGRPGVRTSITYQRGYALGVMDAIGYVDPTGVGKCLLKKARSVNEAYDWSARVWNTTTTITQSAAGALIVDATQNCS